MPLILKIWTSGGGQIEVGQMNRTLRLKGQLTSSSAIENLLIKTPNAGSIRLKDVATVIDTVKQKESYARLDGKNVITLNIIKRAGENLINCAAKVKEIVEEMKASRLTQRPRCGSDRRSKQTGSDFFS